MSDAGGEPVLEIGPDYLSGPDGGFYTLALYNDGT